jgi:lipoate-protein ligase A
VLHHTTIAYQMNMPLMLKVLRIGKEKLSDKGIASADKRVGPLRQQTHLERDAIIAHMIDTFRRKTGGVDDEVTPEERAESDRLVETRFGTREWIYVLP